MGQAKVELSAQFRKDYIEISSYVLEQFGINNYLKLVKRIDNMILLFEPGTLQFKVWEPNPTIKIYSINPGLILYKEEGEVIILLRFLDGRKDSTAIEFHEPEITYTSAGVNKEEGYRAVELMKQKVAATHNENVLHGLGSFGAFYALKDFKKPVLVSGTDGVGTKLKVAFDVGKYDSVGIDCVAMCVNDVLCHGAQPLFFLDYLACGKLDAEIAAEIVGGIAEGCTQAGAALIGGETAEMPGFYQEGDYDIAGFTVGAVERSKVIDGSKVQAGDVIIGLASSGVHSNGFSLVRKVITEYHQEFEGKPMFETLLEPTKIYVKPVMEIIEKYEVHGLAHITGGGLIENVPRALNANTNAVIEKNNIDVPPIFKYIIQQGVPENEMWGTFNMGIGFIVIVKKQDAQSIIATLTTSGEKVKIIGTVSNGAGEIILK